MPFRLKVTLRAGRVYRAISLAIAIAFLMPYNNALGQELRTSPGRGVNSGPAISSKDISDYSSKDLGAQRKWQLDKGYFDVDPRLTGSVKPGVDSEGYSGIRIRRPRQ
jgi:hypothetical protein